MSTRKYHDPSKLFTDTTRREERALLILNQPIESLSLLDVLWHTCDYRICADGGANRLYDLTGLEGEGDGDARHKYLPSCIHGDLDSLLPEVGQWYEAQGVEVSKDPDQYSTDFGKAMQKITGGGDTPRPKDVIILGGIGGRIDQGLGLISEMSREQAKHPDIELWLVSEASLSWILAGDSEGGGSSMNHVIDNLIDGGIFSENIGILPVFGPAVLKHTKGLEWDVHDWPTQIGGNVSTSNHVKSNLVEIESTANVLFTVERVKYR